MKVKQLTLSTLGAGFLYMTTLSSTILLSESVLAGGPSYTPPQVGAPNRRVGGGTRGTSDTPAPTLAVLSPQSTGYTQQAQPTLYWAISQAVDYPISIMLVETNPVSLEAMQPLLEKRINVSTAGIQSLSLKEQNVTLKAGVEYEWFVSVIRNPAKRSEDLTTTGVLKYIASGQAPKITSCLDKASESGEAYANYAQCGLWYDAMDSLISQRDSKPNDVILKTAQQSLLNQVELPQVAALIQ
jgi:hypothetical protein